MAETSSSAGSAGAAGSIPIEMPRLSSEEGTATLSAWLVAEGDIVEKGTLVAELETDKATVELESPAPGRIESLIVRAGTDGLKPGMLLGRIAAPSARSAATVVSAPAVGSRPAAGATLPPKGPPEAPSQVDLPGRSPATPLARRVADSQGVALEGVKGTGVGGRIEKADVERLARAAPSPAAAAPTRARARADGESSEVASAASTAAAAGQTLPARALQASAQVETSRPAVQLELRCEMDAVVAARTRLNASRPSAPEEAHLTLNDFVLRAAALALRDVPAANLRRAGGGFHRADGVDVAVVVATDAGPRLVVIRNADRKGLAVLSEEVRAKIEQARTSEPPAPEDTSASLLVTNFGRFGVESVHPMLPPEQLVVLAVGALVEQPSVRGGVVGVAPKMALTLAFDPAASSGGVMGQLLGAIRRHLEDPLGMML